MDHEASNAQEWQLPGYGRGSPKKRATSTTIQAQASAPRNTSKPEAQRQAPPTAAAGPRNPTAARGAPRARGRGYSRARAATHRGAMSAQPSRLFRDSPAKSRWRNGLEHTGAVPLPAPFGTFKHEFSGAARSAIFAKKPLGIQGRNEVFEEISKRTGAFVKPPAYSDKIIHLWGEPAQVAAAEEIIKGLIVKCISFRPNKRADWIKIKSHSVNKEADAELKEKRESMVQQLRKPPESSDAFPEQLLFLWPKDGPSLNECLGPQLEALDIIRVRFGCHLFVPKDLPGYICALGHSHDSMKQIAQRIRTLWTEGAAKTNVKAKVYIVEPPKPNAMKDKIVVEKQANLHMPALSGDRLKGAELEHWQSRANLIQSKNSSRILSAVENCLRGVSFVRGHLRMRVNIGSFVLHNYRKPEDDKSWYGFEEFREMLLHEQTKARLIPGLRVGQSELLERCFKASHLLEPYDTTTTSLESAELAFSVNFEFMGADKSMLRLEAEFAKSPGAEEYEITQRRWLRPRTSGQSGEKRSPLHVAVVDFGRSDWQLEIKSLEFYETSSIDTALRTFSHSIGFRRTANVGDISAKPERKVTFPTSAPVSRFVEKSAIRYRLKGTKYILEIARYDEFSRVPAFPGQPPTTFTGNMSEVPCTSWGASVFDANWDNLLGGHANLPVGHAAKYSPKLDTFFPSKEPSSKLEDKAKGFWEFIDLVKQAAELLGPTRSEEEVNASAPGDAGLLNADLGTLF